MDHSEISNNNYDNQNREYSASVHFEGKTYHITSDNKVFTIENGNKILASDDEIKKLIIFLNQKKPYNVYYLPNTFANEISTADVYNAIIGIDSEQGLNNNSIDESEDLSIE